MNYKKLNKIFFFKKKNTDNWKLNNRRRRKSMKEKQNKYKNNFRQKCKNNKGFTDMIQNRYKKFKICLSLMRNKVLTIF